MSATGAWGGANRTSRLSIEPMVLSSRVFISRSLCAPPRLVVVASL